MRGWHSEKQISLLRRSRDYPISVSGRDFANRQVHVCFTCAKLHGLTNLLTIQSSLFTSSRVITDCVLGKDLTVLCIKSILESSFMIVPAAPFSSVHTRSHISQAKLLRCVAHHETYLCCSYFPACVPDFSTHTFQVNESLLDICDIIALMT